MKLGMRQAIGATASATSLGRHIRRVRTYGVAACMTAVVALMAAPTARAGEPKYCLQYGLPQYYRNDTGVWLDVHSSNRSNAYIQFKSSAAY